ncbi:MAG: dihydrolipoyl dehydrogenase [Thiocapsa sp.]|jgi:dihydrolipoamide dehydrogenase|nr:dihydrolipoyl dehydrogenase [Thiocapsa sp.]MCG6896229.1 dihydrolipoyl dehydrogenase [Thiocapsa sp.]MCG6983591.1 dihydrolipoyl dehydrogenase [Thiocapsa sp.]
MVDRVDVAVIGAGHAGLNAIKEIRKVTDDYVLINGGGLGTTCARVGCMPSKVAVHLAEVYQTRKQFQRYGIDGADALRIDQGTALEHVRDLRDTFVDLVLANTTDEMGDELIEGFARFIDAETVQVGERVIRADAFVIASGASTVVPSGWEERLGDRILTVESLFEQDRLPESVAVLGLGPIGIEIGQALHRLGVCVVGIEAGEKLARLQDPVVSQAAVDILRREFPVWLGQPAEVEPSGDRVRVRAGDQEMCVEKLFVAMGRRPNLAGLGLERVGCQLDPKGVPLHDPQTLRVGPFPIYLAGDATGGMANLQTAAEQGRIAGFNACHGAPLRFDPKTPMSIIFSDPNIAVVGTPFSALDQAAVVVGQQRFGPVGRALIMGQNRGLMRLYADRRTGLVLGGAMVGPRCEHLAHLLAWGIQCRLSVREMLKMPFYHPVIEEALQDCLHELDRRLDAPARMISRPSSAVA